MARETIKTARGVNLNMEELKMKANRPLVSNVDMKDKIESKAVMPRQINVRGHIPSLTGIVAPQHPSRQVKEQAKPVEEAPTMAELTGVTIDEPKHLKGRPENPTGAANETLREIMGDLEQFRTPSRSEKAKDD